MTIPPSLPVALYCVICVDKVEYQSCEGIVEGEAAGGEEGKGRAGGVSVPVLSGDLWFVLTRLTDVGDREYSGIAWTDSPIHHSTAGVFQTLFDTISSSWQLPPSPSWLP